MRKFPIYLLLEIHFLDTPRCSIGAINHLQRRNNQLNSPLDSLPLEATDLLVLLCVPLTVLLPDGGPADGAHVVHAAPLVHHQPRHGEPGPRPPPGQQHTALLVMVTRVISRQPGVWV